MTGDSVAKKRKRAAKKRPAMKGKRAWVPVSPTGVVHWHLANRTRHPLRESISAIFGYWQSWENMRKQGWRIVRCRVEG
jgi:hypothetical protein